MENKTKGNKDKIILADFSCTLNKMDRDSVNKTRKICRCRSNYALSKLIVVNGLKYLWRRENPDSAEFTHYDRSSGTKTRIDRVYTDIKIASNTKVNHIMVLFTGY